MIVCRHMPPAPGCHGDPDPWREAPKPPPSSPPSTVGKRARFHSRVDDVWIGQRRFQMPYPFELPRVRVSS